MATASGQESWGGKVDDKVADRIDLVIEFMPTAWTVLVGKRGTTL